MARRSQHTVRRMMWGFFALIYALTNGAVHEGSAADSKLSKPSSAVEEPIPEVTTASSIVFYRQRRANCTPPAIEQFPKPSMGPYWRKHGGLIFHILICIYSFIGLAIVCDEYFVTSLDRICEGWTPIYMQLLHVDRRPV